MRVAVEVDSTTGRLGLALERRGAPRVPGLGVGALLLASERLDGSSVFARSVVLLTEAPGAGGGAAGSGGAGDAGGGAPGAPVAFGHRGVVLTQPLEGAPPAGGPGAADTSAPAALATRPRHFLGGPVGMPGAGAGARAAVLHGAPGVAGARPVLPGALWEGGALAEVLERIAALGAAAAAAAKAAGRAGAGAAAAAAAAAPPVLVFHGVAEWRPGQLERELRAGVWLLAPGEAGDAAAAAAAPPGGLWRVLTESGRARRAA